MNEQLMEKHTTSSRFASLDGLRGFAIILVVLNHLTHSFFPAFLPEWLAGPFFSDGVTGVTLLFLLSGFLMTYIYPTPVSWSAFVQKRYTRIFPLFLVMCCVMFVYHLSPKLPGFSFLFLLAGLTLGGHVLWVYGIKKLPTNVSRMLFFSFLFLQAIVAAWYVLYVMRQPAIVFNQQLPEIIKEATIFLVNATLTLPLGDYVPMLDGVYWSLVAEVIFYLLYPILVVPLVLVGKRLSRGRLFFFLVSLFLFIGGTHMLLQGVAVMSLIQPALWSYFLVGILLAVVYKEKQQTIEALTEKFSGRWGILSVILLFTLFISEHALGNITSNILDPWIRLVYAIPIGVLVLLLLHPKTVLAKIFSNSILVGLGTISYSIYLSHEIIIHILDRYFIDITLWGSLFYLLVVSCTIFVISTALYWSLERPYFLKRASGVKEQKIKKYGKGNYLVLAIWSIYVVGIFFVYQSQLNFFSLSYAIPRSQVVTASQSHLLSLEKQPMVHISFTGETQDLGIVSARFLHEKQAIPTNQRLIFSLKEATQQTPIVSAAYTLDYFNSKEPFPFGFPRIRDSQGKKYIAQFSLENPNIKDTLLLDTTSLQTIYAANKQEIIQDPTKLTNFLVAKVKNVTLNTDAQIIFLVSVPLLLSSLIMLLQNRSKGV